VGNNGNNVLAGGLGADSLEGGFGDDIYVLSDDNDTIIDTGGIDTIRSVLDIDLVAGIENAELVGIFNTNANGTAVDNIITGNLGNNTLDGKGGVDKLTGGMGADSFILSYNGDGIDADLIMDFTSGEDLLIIDLGSFGVDVEALGLAGSGLASESSFVARAGAQPLDPDDHFIFDTAQGTLKFDYDGSGSLGSYDIATIYIYDQSSSLTATDLYIAI
jgi:Ca2+-binding RTX toxin-like protein